MREANLRDWSVSGMIDAGGRSTCQEFPRNDAMDVYFSADVETDGPIPGPFSMLSFALVYTGCFDGEVFQKVDKFDEYFCEDLKPISDEFEMEALGINRIDRSRLLTEGTNPELAMTRACEWVKKVANGGRPILVAYPLSFDWTWLYWYFTRFSKVGSPFNHSGCFDIKTAYAVKAGIPIAGAGRDHMLDELRSDKVHSHNALEDAIEQAEIFTKLFTWSADVHP